MCCCKPYEEQLNYRIKEERRAYNNEKNILLIGSSSCSTFYQLQQHYNMQYDRTYVNDACDISKTEEQNDIVDKKLNLLIDGYINNITSQLSWNIIPSEIYQLIWQYYPKQKCLIVSKSSVIRHDYRFRGCHFRVAHIHETNANYEFLNKIIHYFMPFDNFICLVYSVSLLITENKQQFQQALQLFDTIINHHSFLQTAIVLWFEDYNEFITRINDNNINTNDWSAYSDHEINIDQIQNGDDAFEFIRNIFCNCDCNQHSREIFVYAIGKSLYWRSNTTLNFINTWHDIHYLLIGMPLARGGLI
eukprot:241795_1